MGAKRYWLITGYDSAKTIFEMKVGIGQITRDQMDDLLRALTAKAGLAFDEMVGAYAKRRTRIANSHLTVQQDLKHSTHSCGSNPHFVARIVDESGKLVRPPSWVTGS